MTRYKLIYLAAVITAAVLCVASGRGILLIPLAFLLCAELVSAVFLLLASRSMTITFKARERCVVERTLPVTVTMTAGSRLPFGRTKLRLRFYNTLFECGSGLELILQPGRGAVGTFEMPYIPADCGRVKITVEQALCYDLFGIVSKRIPKMPDMEVVVYPVIRDFSIKKSRLPHSTESSDQYDLYRHGQDVTEVFDMRDYREGDSLRSIHWKLSSKIDHLVVREFSDPTRYRTMLFYTNSMTGAAPTDSEHRVMNAVLAMTAALSKNMMEENLPHSVLSFPNRTLDQTQVESRDSFEIMLNKLMCGRIADCGMEQIEYFSEMGVFGEFSKVLVVTGGIDQEILRKISEKINITALELSVDGVRRVEQQGNMEIIRIPLNELEESVHAIEI